MKRVTLAFLFCLVSITIFAQDISGQWNGALKLPGMQLRLAFHITKADNGYISTMDSPDQGVKGIPTTTTSFENSILKISIKNANIEYEGTLGSDHTIVGTFKQNGQTFSMNLSKDEIEKEKPVRPQEPTKPYPYYSEDITYENKKAGITLAGTLTLPQKDGVFPVVILISGSGPQNRDEEILGHKPFLVLSDYLTRNGIAVLRYDDRGTALSTGNFSKATSLDFSSDVESAIDYLKTRKEINKNKIGLIGHSEGGMIAPMVAAKSKDVSFIVLLAGTGIPGDQILLIQQKRIAKASGVSDEAIQKNEVLNRKAFDIVNTSTDLEQLKTNLTNYFKMESQSSPISGKPEGMSDDQFIDFQVNQIANPWMHFFINHNPASSLEKVKCPVLALNGEKDLQVTPKENLEAIAKALTKGKNNKFTIKELPNLNHLFQECQTGAPSEYGGIEQTFSPDALHEILLWIQNQTK